MAAQGPLRAVTHEGRRFLCFCEGGSASPRLLLTNACEFWSCTIPLEKLTGQELISPEEGLSRLREILQGQALSLTVQDSRATVRLQDGKQSWLFELYKASLSEARKQLQDLTFGLVEQVEKLEKRLQESVAASLPLQSPKKQVLPSQSPFEAMLSWRGSFSPLPENQQLSGVTGNTEGKLAAPPSESQPPSCPSRKTGFRKSNYV